jgi:hypothetical protein
MCAPALPDPQRARHRPPIERTSTFEASQRLRIPTIQAWRNPSQQAPVAVGSIPRQPATAQSQRRHPRASPAVLSLGKERGHGRSVALWTRRLSGEQRTGEGSTRSRISRDSRPSCSPSPSPSHRSAKFVKLTPTQQLPIHERSASRIDNQHTGAIVVVGQRLHIDDLIGTLLRSGEKWTVLTLPAIAEKEGYIPIGPGRWHLRRVGDLLIRNNRSASFSKRFVLKTPKYMPLNISKVRSRPAAS